MNNIMMKNNLSGQQLAMVQSEMENKKKSKGIAYVLWLFTGGIGGHRFYAGDIGLGIGMLLTLGGFGIWTLIDLFLIGNRIEKKNEEVERTIIHQVKSFDNKGE